MISQNTKMTIGHLISKYLLTFVRFLLLWVLANFTVSQMFPDRKRGSFEGSYPQFLLADQVLWSLPANSSASWKKALFLRFLRSLLITYLITLSLKKKYCWKKGWPKSFKILDPKICTNTVLTLLVPKVTNINFVLTTSADHQEQRLWELLNWLPKGERFDLKPNSLNYS